MARNPAISDTPGHPWISYTNDVCNALYIGHYTPPSGGFRRPQGNPRTPKETHQGKPRGILGFLVFLVFLASFCGALGGVVVELFW